MTFLRGNHHSGIVFPRFAVLVASSAFMASQNSPDTSSQTSLTMREFKTLRERANTAEDYRKLAAWCRLKAEHYRKRKSNLEAELGKHDSRISPQSNPKHSTRGQSLHALAVHYGDLSRQWTDLSEVFSHRAAELDASPAK